MKDQKKHQLIKKTVEQSKPFEQPKPAEPVKPSDGNLTEDEKQFLKDNMVII